MLNNYSFRILTLTSFIYIVINYSTLAYPVYVIAPLCLIPLLIFDLFLSDHLKSRKYAGIIFELIPLLSAMSLLNIYLFSNFMILMFFNNFQLWKFKIAVIVNFGIITSLIIFKLFLGSGIDTFVVLVPVILLSFLLYKLKNETEIELKTEIDAQQTQIDGKNKLLSTLSHELRTPLAVIKTSTEIILEERPGEINTTQKRFLTAVLDNTMRLVRFVDTILASIKVEYAWFRMNKKPMDIRTVIKKVCNDLLPFISSRDQTLKYTYPNLISRTIADENWIQQVLINLIHNASKHVGKNGRIIISVTENEQCIVVSVSDDGSGIVNQEKPKIFSEFYQGSESEDENMDGVGLGLSIVKNVIEKHDGKVYVGSVAGLGTTLSFTLPKEGGAGCSTKF